MTTPSAQSFRKRLDLTENHNHIHALALGAVSVLEVAEARIAELQQLMAQGHSKARRNGLQRDALSRELYRTQMVLEGVSADYGDSPMAIQARPPVSDVSGLLIERLKRDADRIGELEAAQQPRPMVDAPPIGDIVHALVPVSWEEQVEPPFACSWFDDEGDQFDDESAVGWLPLPDQSEVK